MGAGGVWGRGGGGGGGAPGRPGWACARVPPVSPSLRARAARSHGARAVIIFFFAMLLAFRDTVPATHVASVSVRILVISVIRILL